MNLNIWAGLVLLLLVSCSDEVNNYPVGSDFVENDLSVKIIDTFLVNAGTFKLDSLVTSGTSRILVGNVKDANFGHLKSQPYFQLNTSTFSIDTDAVFDSIGLVLHYDKYHYGDTTQIQTYKVHRLLEYFEPEEGSDFYNTSKLAYAEDPLGEVSFTPRPNKTTDSIYVPLAKAFGEALFNEIKDGNINSADDFQQYLKGLTIVPDTVSSSHVLGFGFQSSLELEANSSLRLFYTQDIDDASEGNSKVLSMYITSASKQFNAIQADLEEAAINDFTDGETIISSTDSNGLIFAQAGTGISARIEMPTLKDLNKLSEDGAALSAELTFSPLKNSYSSEKPLKDSLAVYVVDHKNRIVSQLTNIDSAASYAVLNQNDDEFNQNTYYSIDMSGFVETILTSSFDLNYAIMIQFLDYDKTVDSVVIEDGDVGSQSIKLNVTYLNY